MVGGHDGCGQNDSVSEGLAIALRMDDVGASSKRFEVYARAIPLPGRASALGNLLFLKYLPGLRAWGPYGELTADDWRAIVAVLRARHVKLTVGVTAAWVMWSGELVPFPERFPAQASILRDAVHDDLVEVANHGLTHCVLANHAFRPRVFGGNRRWHREFYDWIPEATQRAHLERAQQILQDWLGREVVTFVPPGNVYAESTLRVAATVGLRVLSCHTTPREATGIRIIGNERVADFHDRDVVTGGVAWLERLIGRHGNEGRAFVFVRDLAA